jgi:uncharacterized repeat protein (TIGR01451 family)
VVVAQCKEVKLGGTVAKNFFVLFVIMSFILLPVNVGGADSSDNSFDQQFKFGNISEVILDEVLDPEPTGQPDDEPQEDEAPVPDDFYFAPSATCVPTGCIIADCCGPSECGGNVEYCDSTEAGWCESNCGGSGTCNNTVASVNLTCANITESFVCNNIGSSECTWSGSVCTDSSGDPQCAYLDNSSSCESNTSDVCYWRSSSAPFEVELISPTNYSIAAVGIVSFNYNVTRVGGAENLYVNCSLVFNGTDNESDPHNSILINSTDPTHDGTINVSMEEGSYNWTVYCMEDEGQDYEDWAHDDWILDVRSTEIEVNKTTPNSSVDIGDTIEFFINISNHGWWSVNDLLLYDTFDGTKLQFLNESNCNVTSFSNASSGFIFINMSKGCANGGWIGFESSTRVELNFTAVASASPTTNEVEVNGTTGGPGFNITSTGDEDVSIAGGAASISVDKYTPGENYTIDDKIEFIVNITNSGTTNLTEILLNDSFSSTKLNLDSTSCPILDSNLTTGWFRINVTSCYDSDLAENDTFSVYINFTDSGSVTAPYNTTNFAEVDAADYFGNTTSDSDFHDVEVGESTNITLSIGLKYPADEENTSSHDLTFTYNVTLVSGSDSVPINCSLYLDGVENESYLYNPHPLTSGARTQDGEINATVPPGRHNWSIYCYDNSDPSNTNVWSATRHINTPSTFNVSVEKRVESMYQVNVTDIAKFSINVTNNGTTDLDHIWLFDDFDYSYLNFTNESSCPVHNFSSESGENNSFIEINVTACIGEPLLSTESFVIYLNFTAKAEGNTSNYAYLNITDSEDNNSMFNDTRWLEIFPAPPPPINGTGTDNTMLTATDANHTYPAIALDDTANPVVA